MTFSVGIMKATSGILLVSALLTGALGAGVPDFAFRQSVEAAAVPRAEVLTAAEGAAQVAPATGEPCRPNAWFCEDF